MLLLFTTLKIQEEFIIFLTDQLSSISWIVFHFLVHLQTYMNKTLNKTTHFLQFLAISLCIHTFQSTQFSKIEFSHENEVIPPSFLIVPDFHRQIYHTYTTDIF